MYLFIVHKLYIYMYIFLVRLYCGWLFEVPTWGRLSMKIVNSFIMTYYLTE